MSVLVSGAVLHIWKAWHVKAVYSCAWATGHRVGSWLLAGVPHIVGTFALVLLAVPKGRGAALPENQARALPLLPLELGDAALGHCRDGQCHWPPLLCSATGRLGMERRALCPEGLHCRTPLPVPYAV